MTGIIVGFDGSEASERALDRGLLEAERAGQGLHVVQVWSNAAWAGVGGMGLMAYPAPEDGRLRATAVLEEVLEKALSRRTSTTPISVTSEVQEGDPARVLCSLGEQASLLVVGGNGHGQVASALLGSVTSYVLHHATCPVMVVPRGPHSEPFARVVVGVDGSPSSRAALDWGLTVAEDSGCPLIAVHAWMIAAAPPLIRLSTPERRATHEEQARDWLAAELTRAQEGHGAATISQRVPYGPVAGTLLEEAGPNDLLVLGSRGHGGFSRLLLGSTASQCAAHAQGPVVIVKQPTA